MARGNTLASAYVALGLETSGMVREIRSAVGKALRDAGVENYLEDEVSKGFDEGSKEGGRKTKSNFGRVSTSLRKAVQSDLAKGLNKGLSMAGRGARRSVAAVGAGVVAGVGVALTKGFQRMSAVENAEASMRGILGEGADATKRIEVASANALTAVKGTAFGIGDAMQAASMGMAAGVKEGEALEGYLTTIGNMATVANIPFDDMAGIMSKITANGRITGETLAQLEERGLAAGSTLAEYFDVSQAEIREMISAGEVGADDFMKAMNAFEGAAQKSGDTTAGALANMGAAFGRLGEVLMGDSFGLIRRFAVEISDAVDGIADVIRPAMEIIHADIINAFGGLDGAGTRFAEYLANNQAAITQMMTDGYFTFKQTINRMISEAQELLSGFAGGSFEPNEFLQVALEKVSELNTAIMSLVQAAVPLLVAMGATGIASMITFMEIMTQVMTIILPVLQWISEKWKELSPEMQAAVANAIAFGIAFGWVLQILRPVFGLLGWIGKTIGSIWKAVSKSPFGKWIKNIKWIRGGAGIGGLGGALATVGTIIGSIASGIGIVAGLIVGLPYLVIGFSDGWDEANGFLSSTWDYLQEIWHSLSGLWNDPSLWQWATVWDGLLWAVQQIWTTLKWIDDSVLKMQNNVIDWAQGLFSTQTVQTQSIQTQSAFSAPAMATMKPMGTMGTMAAATTFATRTTPTTTRSLAGNSMSGYTDRHNLEETEGKHGDNIYLTQNITAPPGMNIEELSRKIYKQWEWEGRSA